MLRLKISEIIQLIEEEKTFEAVSSSYSFTIKISEYVPFVCAAVICYYGQPAITQKLVLQQPMVGRG